MERAVTGSPYQRGCKALGLPATGHMSESVRADRQDHGEVSGPVQLSPLLAERRERAGLGLVPATLKQSSCDYLRIKEMYR